MVSSSQPSHCYHIVPWLCVWNICYIIFCYLLHIHSRKTRNLFSLLLCSLWWKQIIGCVLTWRSHSFICTLHNIIMILFKLIWRHCPYKMLVRYSLSSVWAIRHIFSVIHYKIRGTVCFQLTHLPCDDWENIYTLSYYHHYIKSKYELLPIV